MPEIIDQANELAERRLEMTIQNMRINWLMDNHPQRFRRYQSGAGNLWRSVSAALIVRKSLKNVVST